MPIDPSEEYHIASRNFAATKHVVSSYKIHYEPYVQELQRTAPARRSGLQRIKLYATFNSLPPLDKILNERRSSRDFSENDVITFSEFSNVLINAYGVQSKDSFLSVFKRRVPNSGNLGSPEIYVVVRHVLGLDPGIYHFDSVAHEVVKLHAGDFTQWLKSNVLFQREHADASAIIFITSNIKRLKLKYGERGYRLALMDVGHVSQNLNLICCALSLKVCATAGFIDREIDSALSIDGIDEATFLAVAIGK